jgi:CBS domain-containing protein
MSAISMHGVQGSYLMPSLPHATVADAMHPGVMICDPDATVTQVARMMASNHVHCVAVMGLSSEHGESLAWGIISDLDLIKAGLESGEQTASAIAKSPILAVEPGATLLEAAQLMASHGASHTLVIDAREQRPIGILSTLDIAAVLGWGTA